MRLTIDDILAAHGIPQMGGAPAPYFGDGSDGAFNPAAGTYTSGTAAIQPGSTTVNSGAGYTNSMPFNISGVPAGTTVQVTGIGVYTGGTPVSNCILYLWDANGNVLASATVTSVNGGWTYATISPVTITAGNTYYVGIYTPSGVNLYQVASAGPQNSTIGGITVSLGLNNYHYWCSGNSFPGTGSYGTPCYAFEVSLAVTNWNTITFTSSLDGPPVVKQFTSVNIPQYCLVTVSQRCKGLIMLVQGDVTINGTISMDGKGAVLDPATNAGYAVADQVRQLYYPLGNNKFIVIGPGGDGGSGGMGGSVVIDYAQAVTPSFTGGQGGQGGKGTWFGGGMGGGGGGGAAICNPGGPYGNGGNGTPGGFSLNGNGGSAVTATSSGAGSSGNAATNGNAGSGNGTGGSGGAAVFNYNSGVSTTAISASGGNNNNSAGGAGGGGGCAIHSESVVNVSQSNPTSGGSGASGAGGGGLILIIAKGNVTIGSTGSLSARGTAGGNGSSGYAALTGGGVNAAAGGGGGGGGAGGGIVAILYKGTLTNSGTINVSGGAGGTGGSGQAARSSGTNAAYGYNGQNGQNGMPGVVQLVKL